MSEEDHGEGHRGTGRGNRRESSSDEDGGGSGSAASDTRVYLPRHLLGTLLRAFAERRAGGAGRNEDDDDDEADAGADDDDEAGAGGHSPEGATIGARVRSRRRSRVLRSTRHPFELEQRAAMKDSELAQELAQRTGGLQCVPAPALLHRRTQNGVFSAADRVNYAMRLLPNRVVGRLMRDLGCRVYSGQFSESGDLLVAAAQDYNVRVFSTNGWKLLRTIETRDIHWTVTSTDLSPDEQFVVYSTISPSLQLCNVRGEYEIHEELDLSEGVARNRAFGVWCAKFSAGGSELLAGTNDESIAVYDVERKALLHKVPAHDDDINAVAFADKRFKSHVFLSGSDDRLIKVWDRRTLGGAAARPVGVLPGHTEGITSLASKGDGLYVLSNSKDQSAKLWDLRRMADWDSFAASPRVPDRFHWDYRWMDYPGWGHPYKHPNDCSLMTYRGHEVLSTLIRAYFSPEATTGQRYIYSASRDGAVYIYDVLTGELVSRLAHHRAPIRDVSWHPTLPILCSSSWDGSLAVVQYAPGGPRLDRAGGAEEEEEDDEDSGGEGRMTVQHLLSMLMARGGGGGGEDDDDEEYEEAEGDGS
mmetsp:Transcript_941/g.2667  ORF Transcript_941/g.2667 Transcript_941/m.2667 type:complete len:588 (-) Transcript_941:66-1829(-)|eukprot:CAMPEP_0196782578 /NCGR_PEP_ID=MMETSP1104-20130614/11635_1 /TAXON_ID=33652 /ORGANISM="Cafeteria sp., Strain Caron Lab Isolate" /LENGTH=587 /DNA_ID=CAMNT_0042152817 /DNA_START=25 /DNA_END=1791 /DNA_ORIENTATION=-